MYEVSHVVRRNRELREWVIQTFDEQGQAAAWKTVEKLREMYPEFDVTFQGEIIYHEVNKRVLVDRG